MRLKTVFLISVVFLINHLALGQEWPAKPDVDTVITGFRIYTPPSNDVTFEDIEMVYVSVDQMPEFPGGMDALKKYIADHIKYPELAKENRIQGTVYVRFIVERYGGISNIKVIRSIDPVLDREAVRVIRSLPKFKPGMQNGHPVRVWFTIPVEFKLQKNN